MKNFPQILRRTGRDVYDGRKRRGKYYSFIMIPSNVLNTNQSVVIFFS